MIIPKVIDWQITNACNRKCKFCYGPTSVENFMELHKAKEVILKFKSLGAKVIGITGGEPLLYPNIIELLQFIKEQGLFIGLNTNCDYYSLFRNEILSIVNALEIPIEASNSQLHDSIRGKNNFNNVFNALTDSFNNGNLIYRIGTVVLDENVEELINIEKMLAQFKDKIIYWKIYEYISYSNKDMKENNFNVFEQAQKINLGKYLNRDKIIFDSASTRSRSYFLVKPTGDVFVPLSSSKQSTEQNLGNILFDDELKILNNWNSFIVGKKYQHCSRCIFRKAGFI